MACDEVAVPVSAAYIPGPPTIYIDVSFDRNLVANPALNVGNWTIRYNNLTHNVIGAAALGNVARIQVVAGIANPGVDEVSYAAAPADVLTLGNMIPVVAFANLPIT